MGKETGIAWADSTFNPWIGCTKISPACDSCYAEAFDARFGGAHWGKDAPRRFFKEDHWNEPLRWNRAAQRGAVGKDGRRWLVFCASLCDVLEKRTELDPWRMKLWGTIKATPHLTWLILSKRPHEIPRLVPDEMREAQNVWWGATVESSEFLWRAEALNELVPRAPVRFLSMEPLLGGVMLDGNIGSHSINWVITGSESGDHPRPMNIDHVRAIQQDCQFARIPLFLKQAEEGSDGISAYPPETTPSHQLPAPNAPYRKRDLRPGPDGIKRAHYIIERPYLDGVQHAEWPE